MSPWLAVGAIAAGALAAVIVKLVKFKRAADVDRVSDDWLREHEYGEGQRGDQS